MGAEEYLDVVDENDMVIGREERSFVHRNGMIHREVHVWFFDGEGKLILQKRAPDKKSWPNYLDATVGGHVPAGMGYVDAALMEAEEETGLKLREEDLIVLHKLRSSTAFPTPEENNQAYRTVYGYRFGGPVESLRVEAGKGAGFVKMSLAEMRQDTVNVIPGLFRDVYLPVWKRLEELV